MLLFPQLQSGAIAQYPLSSKYSVSNVTNLQEDGSRYKSGGTNPVQLDWRIAYTHLSQLEADVLGSFFETTLGRLVSFTFLDPMVNLLSWSEDLSQPAWAKSPLVTVTTATNDGDAVTQLASSGPGSMEVSQTLQCPTAAMVCFSLFARTDQATSLTLSIDGVQQTFPLNNTWKQYFITAGGTGSDDIRLVTVSMSGQAQISRLMVSPQPAPGLYTSTQATSGVRPSTRFDQDNLLFTALGPGDFSCEVQLTSRLN